MESVTEKAITLMLWERCKQIFIDKNKRTVMTIANKEMIINGGGIISIPNEHIKNFYQLLIEFYETNNLTKIKDFVYENCIDELIL